ncbi:MAG: sugar phosphate isomerase/epimerase [Verrucomicrobiales bacterium]|nr:sugar phosphate isomerase/epimerase [Verrucomicrobiales bacterium]
MKRRYFLYASTGGLACLADEAAGPLAGRIKLAVKYQMILEPDLSVLEKLELLKRIGFDGTELSSWEKVDHDELLEAIRETGIPVHGIVNAGRPEILPAISLAKKLKSESVLVYAAEDKSLSYNENFAFWQKRVREALPAADEAGIKICIENVRATFLKTAEGMAKFIDSFETDTVRSYFDLGNTITWTEQPGEHWAEVLGKRIHKLDIKDRGHAEFGDAKQKRKGITSGTNGGEVNWADVRRHLAANGFSGWATAEVRGGNEERLTRMKAWMEDVLDLK